eukprot:COSAG01_NODE_23_length_37704_cov_30.005877_3_plen_166_part_00
MIRFTYNVTEPLFNQLGVRQEAGSCSGHVFHQLRLGFGRVHGFLALGETVDLFSQVSICKLDTLLGGFVAHDGNQRVNRVDIFRNCEIDGQPAPETWRNSIPYVQQLHHSTAVQLYRYSTRSGYLRRRPRCVVVVIVVAEQVEVEVVLHATLASGITRRVNITTI